MFFNLAKFIHKCNGHLTLVPSFYLYTVTLHIYLMTIDNQLNNQLNNCDLYGEMWRGPPVHAQ